jgi:predicted nuclease with TOPRIM domain
MEQSERSNNSNTVVKAGLILAIALASIFGYLYFDSKQELSQKNVDITEKTRELLATNSKLDSISSELDKKIAEVTALGGEVEGLQALKAQLDRDKKQLMNSKNISLKEFQNKIKGYEVMLLEKDAEIAKLREENAVLNNQNQALNSENSSLKTVNSDLQTTKTALTDSVYSYSVKNKELAEKVTLAAALKPMNISVTAINSRGRERDGEAFKARRVDKVKVNFKLAENPLTRKENKTIYLRMVDPAGNVISDMATGSGAFNFGGKETIYTAKQTVAYSNTGQTVEYTYSKGSNYPKGTYQIELYSENFRIGQSSFIIK